MNLVDVVILLIVAEILKWLFNQLRGDNGNGDKGMAR